MDSVYKQKSLGEHKRPTRQQTQATNVLAVDCSTLNIRRKQSFHIQFCRRVARNPNTVKTLQNVAIKNTNCNIRNSINHYL